MTAAHHRKPVTDDSDTLEPMSPLQLAKLQRSLNESLRFPFLIALRSDLADLVVIEAHRLEQQARQKARQAAQRPYAKPTEPR